MISRLSATAALFAVLATVSIAWATATDKPAASRAEPQATDPAQPEQRLPTVTIEVKRASAPQR